MKKEVPPLCGSSSLLLKNPDRGFRLEVYLNVATGLSMFDSKERDAFEFLDEQVKFYADDSPALAQVYFYITDYWNRDLDALAFERMEAYFAKLKQYGIKALLRFAYTYFHNDDGGVLPSGIPPCEPAPAQIVSHIKQLRRFLFEHKPQIHVLQAGFIGRWGEFHVDACDRANQEHNRVNGEYGVSAVLGALAENTPDDMFLQVRLRNYKSMYFSPRDSKLWDRIGYHDDFIITKPHFWNVAGFVTDCYDALAVMRESLKAPMDGEMIWGSANHAFLDEQYIDAEAVAIRLKDYHYMSLSLTHNYKEQGGQYSMEHWKGVPALKERLAELGLPYADAWFEDCCGKAIERNMFEYIRDYLGYYLVITSVGAARDGGNTTVKVTVKNYGFAPPLKIKSMELALIAHNQKVIHKTQCEGDPALLLPGTEMTFTACLPDDSDSGKYEKTGIAAAMRNEAGTPIRFANDVPVFDGYHLVL